MPRTWKRKTQRGQFTDADLNSAIQKVQKGEMSKREACRSYKIGRATLDRYLEKTMGGEKATKVSKSYSNTVFSESEEKALASYIVECGQMFYGLSTNDLSVLAYQYAIANNKSVPTSWQTYKAAGKTWVWGFHKRHNLALRTPENTSMA